MTLVSGTGRSGTSLWMRILKGLGLPVLGEEFPFDWGERLRQANPDGFFETAATTGINFTLPGVTALEGLPDDVCVKVFLFGIRRSELRFFRRVLVTVRDWPAVHRSVTGLMALDSPGAPFPSREDVRAWWFREHLDLLADSRLRRYDVRWVRLEDLKRDPEGVIRGVADWLGAAGPVKDAATLVRAASDPPSTTPMDDSPFESMISGFLEGVDRGGRWSDEWLAEAAALRASLPATPISWDEIRVAGRR